MPTVKWISHSDFMKSSQLGGVFVFFFFFWGGVVAISKARKQSEKNAREQLPNTYQTIKQKAESQTNTSNQKNANSTKKNKRVSFGTEFATECKHVLRKNTVRKRNVVLRF